MKRIIIGGEIYPEQWVNWADETRTISRSNKYHGVTISKTLQIEVIEDAYLKIKSIDDADDLAGELTIKTQYYDSSLGWVDDFDGYVDFESIEYDTDMTQVINGASKTPVNKLTFSAYSSTFANKLIERQSIEIPYDRLETLDGQAITPFTNEYYQVDIDGIEIKSIGNGKGSGVQFQSDINGSSMILDVIFEGNNEDLKTVRPRNLPTDGSENRTVIDAFFVAYFNTVVELDFTLDYSFSAPSGTHFVYVDITEFDEDGEKGPLVQRIGISQQTTSGDYTLTVSGNYSLNINEGIYIWSSFIPSGGSFQYTTTTKESSVLDIEIFQKADPTPCYLVPPFEMGTRIIESYTGVANGLDSPFLGRTDSPVLYSEDGEGSLFFRTNGRLIRQFPIGYETTDSNKKAQLTDSLEGWFDSLDKIFCLGAGVKYEDGQYKFYVDDRKEFYKNEVVAEFTLDEIELDTFKRSKDMSLYINKIEVGSSYEKPEETGALEEYNAKQNYSSPAPNDNDYDLANDNIFAAYPIETSRRKTYFKEIAAIITGGQEQTTDYKYDDNNFIFNVERDGLGGFQQLSDTDFEEINGLENITTYINLNITPQRILRKYHGWYINSGFAGYQADKLKYNKSDKVITDLSTRKTGESDAIIENSDILISDLDSPRFTGKKIVFQARIEPYKFNRIVNGPYGLIAYPDLINGGTGYGFIPRGGEISTNLVDKTTNVELWETTGFSEEGNFILLQDGNYLLLEDGGRFKLED